MQNGQQRCLHLNPDLHVPLLSEAVWGHTCYASPVIVEWAVIHITFNEGQTKFNRGGMGLLLVLVSLWFRENVVVTYKIGSFLCSLDNLLQKNVIVLFFENQISKWHSFEKRAIFDLLFTFFSYQGKVTKISSAHISLAYMYFAHPNNFFCLTNFEKNTNLLGMVSLWYNSWCWFLFAPFWNNR